MKPRLFCHRRGGTAVTLLTCASLGALSITGCGERATVATRPQGRVATEAAAWQAPAEPRYAPRAVAADSRGNVYVACPLNHTLSRISPEGAVSPLAGMPGVRGAEDGLGFRARFNAPWGIAVDKAGNVYVADTENHTIRQITPSGEVKTLAGAAGQPGSADGPGPQARFYSPRGVAVGGAGVVYVSDYANHTIRKLTCLGTNWLVSTLAGCAQSEGATDGPAQVARFRFPRALAVDQAGNLFVADFGNLSLRKLSATGGEWRVSTFFRAPFNTIDRLFGLGHHLGGLAVYDSGNLLVVYADSHAVWKVTPAGSVSVMAGLPFLRGSADGGRQTARFNSPYGLAVDEAGNVYVADAGNYAVRKLTPAGVTTTLAGVARWPGSS